MIFSSQQIHILFRTILVPTSLFLTLFSSCLSEDEKIKEEIVSEKNIETTSVDSTLTMYLINKEFGVHHPDSFLSTDPSIIDTINPYSVKKIQTKTGIGKQYALIYSRNLTTEINLYLIFDDMSGEGGGYLLLSVNTKGIVLDYIEFKGGDSWEHGGYKSFSSFISRNRIKTTYIESIENESAANNYLGSWSNTSQIINYLITNEGEFISNKEEKLINNNDTTRLDF